jgi:hypothetical protein
MNNNSNLSELLEHSAERVNVRPPSVIQIIEDASRQRRRRAWAVASVATLACAAAITALLALPGSLSEPSQPVGPANQAETIPATRLVGLGNVAIAVPNEWGTNDTHCGTPMSDTVVINVDVTAACAALYPEGVESVELRYGEPYSYMRFDRTIEVDGVRAERLNTTCSTYRETHVCSGALNFPSLDVWFYAESSTSAAELDRILKQVRVVPDMVGVPAFAQIGDEARRHTQELYLDALAEAGLKADIQTQSYPDAPPGFVLDVSPAPGTMLLPGDIVTVTVVADPEGQG